MISSGSEGSWAEEKEDMVVCPSESLPIIGSPRRAGTLALRGCLVSEFLQISTNGPSSKRDGLSAERRSVHSNDCLTTSQCRDEHAFLSLRLCEAV